MINIMGWYSKDNIGDDAFKDCFRTIFHENSLNKLNFHTMRPDVSRPIILGGGDVVKEFYIHKLSEAPAVVLCGVGLGYESEVNLLKSLNIPLAIVRNKADADILIREGINAIYSPDITYILPDVAIPEDRPPGKKRLGVLLSEEINPTYERRASSEYMYYEYYKWEFASSIDELSEYYDIEFVPFSCLNSIDDRRIAGDIFRRCRNRESITLVDKLPSVEAARTKIATYDLLVTMKFHGIMFAVQSGVPFINIAETRKTQLFCSENGLSHLTVQKFSFDKTRFLEFVKTAELASTKSVVKTVGLELKEQIKGIFHEVRPTLLKIVSNS